jgi:hypothetical protein
VIAQIIATSRLAKSATIKIAFTGCARIELDSDVVEAAVARTITLVLHPPAASHVRYGSILLKKGS